MSNDFRALLAANKCRQSMSRRANCYDNATAESFCSRYKAELLEGGAFRSSSNRFGLAVPVWRESVVRGTNRFGQMALNPSRFICERTAHRPALTPSARSCAAIRRDPERRRWSSKMALTRAPSLDLSALAA